MQNFRSDIKWQFSAGGGSYADAPLRIYPRSQDWQCHQSLCNPSVEVVQTFFATVVRWVDAEGSPLLKRIRVPGRRPEALIRPSLAIVGVERCAAAYQQWFCRTLPGNSAALRKAASPMYFKARWICHQLIYKAVASASSVGSRSCVDAIAATSSVTPPASDTVSVCCIPSPPT